MMGAEREEERPDAVEVGSAGSSHGSTGSSRSDASMEIARILAEDEDKHGDEHEDDRSETPPGLPPAMLQLSSPPLPSPPPAIGGASFAESSTSGSRTGQSRTSSAVSRATELRHARQQRAQVLSTLQQQYSIVEQNVSRLEQRCAKAEDEALKQSELAAKRLDAKVSAEAAAEELRTEIASLHDALLKSEKALASTKETAAAEAETSSARALQEVAKSRSQLEAALESYEAAMAAKSRAEAASARAQASCVAAETSAQDLAIELTELRRAYKADRTEHQELLTELAAILAGVNDGAPLHESSPTKENLVLLAQAAVAGCRKKNEDVAACKLQWERESAALSEQWELASVAMLSRLSTMSQRVGRGERMVTRLTAAAEVLASTPRPTVPEPEPEPEPEPRGMGAPDRVPQLQAALDKSTATVQELEQKLLSTCGELEETRRAFHKLYDKYSRAKEMLAHEKRQRRSVERDCQRYGERTHIHYVIEGPPPSDKHGRPRRSRRSSRNADDGGSVEEDNSPENRDRESAEDERAVSPSVGSVQGEESDPEEGRFEPKNHEHQAHHHHPRHPHQQSYSGRDSDRSRSQNRANPGGGLCYDHLYEAHRKHYEERELCRGNYDVAQERERRAGSGSTGRHGDGLRWQSQPRVVRSHPTAAGTTRVASAAY